MVQNCIIVGEIPNYPCLTDDSTITLDEKGRLAIPARFKDIPSLKENPCLVVTNHLDCLWAFTKDGWHGIQDRIAKMSLMNEQLRSLRLFLSVAPRNARLNREELPYRLNCVK
jgi:DNA-binding transcriptional regulator/RsmH inhibitor MraZ